jgi:alkylation response protein AidB-like acyl-CoA dehydrogenase
MALGYSEPDAGTDLASLRTRGEPHGHHWVVTGQKLWTSEAHTATHLWLAARTGPTSPKHSGISLFVVDMDSPGITVRSLRTWSDLRTNEVFLDAVRIPRENLIGEADKGWRYITAALGFERVMTAAFVASARRDFDQLVSYSRDTVVDGQPILQRPGVRRRLAELDRDLELGWLLGLQTAAAIDRGDVPMAEAAMLKVYGSDLQSRVARAGTEILGPAGQLDRHDPHAPLRGAMEWLYRQAPLMRFAAGANEIQRDIIGRAAGLPESRAGVASGRGAR